VTTPNPAPDTFVRLGRPAVPVVKLTAEHEPDAPPASTGEWARLSRPALSVVELMAEPIPPVATVRLALPLAAGDDGNRMFQTLRSLIEKVNEMEALFNRAGVWVDGTRSDVQGGEVVIVLAPNDPVDALETCKRVADYLFAASRKTRGIVVTVFAADQPETPVYELAV
jgi:hypothetical protein